MPNKKKIEGQEIKLVTCCVCGKSKGTAKDQNGCERYFANQQLAALDLSPWDGPSGMAHLPCGSKVIWDLFGGNTPKDKNDKA